MAKNAYFHLLTADNDDLALGDAKVMGYVPPTCLLGGQVVWHSISVRRNPCWDCNGPREKCKGVPRQTLEERGAAAEVERLMAIFKDL